jgi:hypothetical protein
MKAKLVLPQEKLIRPSNWYLSTPNLSGGTYLHDIVGDKKITPNRVSWKNFNSKPGALGACLTNVGVTGLSSLDLSLVKYGGLTISFWINFNSFTDNGIILFTDRIRLNTKSTGQLNFLSSHGGSAVSTNTLSPNRWYHITIVNQLNVATSHYLYVDGVSWISGLNYSTHTSINITAFLNYGFGNGGTGTQNYADIDDIMVFEQILSGSQIKEHYKNALQRKYRYGLWQSSCVSDICTMLLGGQF